MGFRTPLAEVRGLGSAHHGADHWKIMHFSSLSLIILFIWFAYSVVGLAPDGVSYEEAVSWLTRCWVTPIMAILFIGAVFHHAYLGISSVMNDYIHIKYKKLILVNALALLCFAAASVGIFSVLRIYFQG